MSAKSKPAESIVYKSKTDKVLADNLRRMIELSPYDSVAAWALSKNLNPRNIQRILAGEQSPGVVLLDEIACKSRVLATWNLLVPNFDVNHPPIALSDAEKRMYADLQERARQIALPKE